MTCPTCAGRGKVPFLLLFSRVCATCVGVGKTQPTPAQAAAPSPESSPDRDEGGLLPDPHAFDTYTMRVQETGLFDILEQRLKGHDEDAVRAARHIADFPDRRERAAELLTSVLGSRHAPLRDEAIRGLAGLGASALPKLLFAATSADREVRIDAVRALGRIGEPDARSAVDRAKTDVDAGVRAAAAKALRDDLD